tara:strand:+ start:125 stop:364 length:240 start_codon:yes stop_codon:yes gene_type:complete
MKITKSQLKRIIKEELALSLLEEAGEQKYCCIDGQSFKLHDAGKRYLFLSCSETTCQMLGKMGKEEFNTKLKSGEFEPI